MGTLVLALLMLLTVAIYWSVGREVMANWKATKPKPMQAAIEELTAHKLQHQTWVEGQKLAMAWWEQQCACPEVVKVTDYREIPGCARISDGACVQWNPLIEKWSREKATPTEVFDDYLRATYPYDTTAYRVR